MLNTSCTNADPAADQTTSPTMPSRLMSRWTIEDAFSSKPPQGFEPPCGREGHVVDLIIPLDDQCMPTWTNLTATATPTNLTAVFKLTPSTLPESPSLYSLMTTMRHSLKT